MTGRIDLAIAFAANAFSLVGYYVHERIWVRIGWDMVPPPLAHDDDTGDFGNISSSRARSTVVRDESGALSSTTTILNTT
jgi:hypothetical protein